MSDNYTIQELEKLFKLIGNGVKRLKLGQYILYPVKQIIVVITALTDTLTSSPPNESIRNLWYSLLPSKEFPFEWIIDDKNVDHYLRISMSSLIPDYNTRRGGSQPVLYNFKIDFLNKKIKEIRTFGDKNIITIGITHVESLRILPIRVPDGVKRFELDGCDKIESEIPYLPESLRYIYIGGHTGTTVHINSEVLIKEFVKSHNIRRKLGPFVNGH